MENEPPTISVSEMDARGTRRTRIMGKLFGRDRDRDRKASHESLPNTGDVNDFLHGQSDKLQVAHPGPPVLAKLDIKTATRYPNALDVQVPVDLQQELAYRSRSRSPRIRLKKGLVVRFVDTYPEVIGNGGDECEVPTVEIGRHRKPRPPAVTAVTAPALPINAGGDRSPGAISRTGSNRESFEPVPLRRTQTGYSTISEPSEPIIPAGKNTPARYLDNSVAPHDDRRRSFIEVHQAEMRQAEGLAFANALRSAGPSAQPAPGPSPRTPEPTVVTEGVMTESPTSLDSPPKLALPPFPNSAPVGQPHTSQAHANEPPQVPQHSPAPLYPQEAWHPQPPQHAQTQPKQSPDPQDRFQRAPNPDQSPSSIYSTQSGLSQAYAPLRQGSKASARDYVPSSRVAHDGVVPSSDDAMDTFVARTRHLFELFRLHSESVRPLMACAPEELVRASLWWFLTGRMALENAVRERPTSPESQRKNDLVKQQAHADLAKAFWLSKEILPEVAGSKRSSLSLEVEEARQALDSTLRKLAVSMARNGFLPPEEALLPQSIDKSVWIEYPQLTQDIVSLLCGCSSSALGQMQQPATRMGILEALPVGDSALSFCFGRFHADVFLMEQGRESQRLYFSCFISIIRPQKQQDIVFVVASQDGTVQLRISAIKGLGVVWDDVRWRSDISTLDIRLPRGFILVVQCSQQNFKTLWNMYEFSGKLHSSLYPKQDEQCLFRSTLRAFQYFDNDPQSRQFPKESISGCEVALFGRVLREGAATGPRTYHRGYRIAVITGPRTKTLSGINQTYTNQAPIQFGFLRSEANDPALSLKFENGRQKGNMVLSFSDEQERFQMHSLLIGVVLQRDEHIFCEIPMRNVWFSERYGDSNQVGLKAISTLPWQRARVINHDNDGDRPPCVLADSLRIIYEFKDGTMTDRMNVAPGELRIRLDVQNPSCIMVFRQGQSDITVAVTEAKVSRELPLALAQGLETLQQSPTIRTFMFPSISDLHAFETAVTGFQVLFDGIASAFAISRRRMVVPIHKKWEAKKTRVQIVQQDGTTQLLAFFDDFAHGQCMGFNLKGTDVFETFNRSGGKAGLKIDDAKFPLPKILAPEIDSAQAAADAAFVCLDLPELPGEHDDISIVFDNESERDKLISCLPAPVKGARLVKR
ncbi:hypothetical protein B0T19DRAFT_38472 [Cercophora scortea]|uniref:Uncharacterized protein n=1 Tax=Cercophora scortea TaxID=314031 RepID=A0AAE0J4J2_9PEZI|nr:hypothetical protein B0T19DRAFT_38472 [Cercophora scortea]